MNQTGSPGPGRLGLSLLKSLVRIALGVLVGATLFLVIFEKRLIYYPSVGLDVTPKEFGLPFEEVLLDVEEGVKVHGWFIKAARESSVATVLLSHGNAGNIADRLDRVVSLRGLGFDFFLYDYRGFGKSTGAPDEEGTYRDGRAAYEHLTTVRKIDPGRLVLMGESVGCAIAMQLALEYPAAGLVLEAPFASIRHMAKAVYPFLYLGPFIRTRYDNLAKVPRLKMPLLIIHGTKDEIVPFSQGRLVFEAAPEPKRFVAIEGAHHNDVYVLGGEAYAQSLDEFVATLIRTPSAIPEKVKP